MQSTQHSDGLYWHTALSPLNRLPHCEERAFKLLDERSGLCFLGSVKDAPNKRSKQSNLAMVVHAYQAKRDHAGVIVIHAASIGTQSKRQLTYLHLSQPINLQVR